MHVTSCPGMEGCIRFSQEQEGTKCLRRVTVNIKGKYMPLVVYTVTTDLPMQCEMKKDASHIP